ncbi:MAG: hypothetical protein ACKN86_14910, partial [Crocinitomicaceae bacterium]
KLSPYVGADLVYGMGNNSAKWDKYDGFGYNADVTATVKNPSSMFGLNLVAGTDYYFAENFYFGLELGLGFMSESEKAGETVVTTAGNPVTTLTKPSNQAVSETTLLEMQGLVGDSKFQSLLNLKKHSSECFFFMLIS